MSDQPIKTHMPSVVQLILSIFGLVTSAFSALALLLIMQIGNSGSLLGETSTKPIYVIIWFGIILSVMAFPSIVLSIRRLARLPMTAARPRFRLLLSSIALWVIITLAYLIHTFPQLISNSFLMVLVTFITVAVPLWWFIEVGRNKIPSSSPQRFWGLINFQVFAGLPLVVLVEIVLLIFGMILGGVWLNNNNQIKPLLMTLQTQMMVNPQDMSILVDQISPLLQTPGVIFALFFSLSIITPLVEEILKPLALWFFIKREWTENEGFTAGLVCGAAFALVESVTAISSMPQENWGTLLIARLGTGLLHTLTAGLTGWGLVSAWSSGKYKRLGLTYLVSMSLHGLWNFFALLSGLGTNLNLFSNSTFGTISKYSPWMLGALFAIMLALLFFMNLRIRKNSFPPPVPPLPMESIE